MKLIFATSNDHKLKEVLSMLPEGIEVVGMKEMGFTDDLPETQDTIEGNSLQKAEHLATVLNGACFAEDTGLEVYALNGEPGVYSARYAGEKATFEDNVNKLLANMQGKADRRARFKTVITYFKEGKSVQFTGITEGKITDTRSGDKGFGYDPVFIPDGSNKTYAEMELAEKNLFSHRRKSFEGFANYLLKNTVL